MGLTLYFGGGEVEKFRKILSEFGSLPISISFLGLQRSNRVLPDYSGKILLDSGAFAMNKANSDTTFEVAFETAAEYMNFIKANIDLVDLVSEFDAKPLGIDTIKELRDSFYNELPDDKFMPVWHPEYGRDELESLCSSYQIVGVSQDDIHGDESNVPLFNQMISRYSVKLHGVGITSKKLLEAVKWSSVSSTAWLSTTRYGETFVWTGRELKRYPVSYKDRARNTHKTLLINNGFDYEKIKNDDSEELLRLSAWSWQRYIQFLSGVTNIPANDIMQKGELNRLLVDNQDKEVRKESTKFRSTTPLPIMINSVPDRSAFSSDEEIKPIINIRSESMRICDSCFLKDKCPGFEPNSTCLYNIPVEIRTKPQLDALQDSLIEMQTHRVLFMKMAEDLSGGYADPNLSSEIDRLGRLVKNKQENGRSTFSMTVTESSPEPRTSFVQRHFGLSTAEKTRELGAPLNTDKLIRESEIGKIIEAEIIDG